MHQDGSSLSLRQNIGKNQLVYNGELEGIVLAMEKARTIATPGQPIRIFADNQAAIYRLQTPSDRPGQQWQIRAIKAAQELLQIGVATTIEWVPGHEGVPGNEMVDAQAKQAAKEPPRSSATSLAMLGVKIRQLQAREWLQALQEYKARSATDRRNTYASRYSWKTSKRLSIPPTTDRLTASTFYQLKLNHGYLKDYLHRIGKRDSPLCSCGQKQTTEHLLLGCKWLKEDRKWLEKELKGVRLSLRLLLHTKKGIEATLAFISRTKVGTRQFYLGEDG